MDEVREEDFKPFMGKRETEVQSPPSFPLQVETEHQVRSSQGHREESSQGDIALKEMSYSWVEKNHNTEIEYKWQATRKACI